MIPLPLANGGNGLGSILLDHNIWVWNSSHSSLTVLPELPVDLPLHHGCHVV
ncbi:unnamed protein product [Prunus brigantina]